jgi:hypothetical protein
MNKLIKEYVETVAQGPVTDREAEDFVQGLDQFFSVSYDSVNKNGYLVTKKSKFNSIKAAMEFIRGLNSVTKPVLK